MTDYDSIISDVFVLVCKRDKEACGNLIVNLINQFGPQIIELVMGPQELDHDFIDNLKNSEGLKDCKVRFTNEGGFVEEFENSF